MKCPICNKNTTVVDVRDRKFDDRRRRRECPICSLRFTTFEVSEERMAELLDYERAFLKFQEVVEKYK